MVQSDLDVVHELHGKWLRQEEGGVHASFVGVDFSGLDFTGMNFTRACFTRCWFMRCDMLCTDFTGATLLNCCFLDAIMSNVVLSGADLEGVIGNTREIKSLQVVRFPVVYTSSVVQIGCKCCNVDDIKENFAIMLQEQGAEKHSQLWDMYKEYLETVMALSPCLKSL